jgi:hypothetical protein
MALQSSINPGLLLEIEALERDERLSSSPGRFTPDLMLPISPGTEWVGSWMISRVSLEAVAKIRDSKNRTPKLGYSSLQPTHSTDTFMQLTLVIA